MKNVLKQLSMILLAMLMLCPVSVGATDIPDTESNIVPYYIVIERMEGTLEINQSGKATCGASVRMDSSDYSVTLTCELCKNGNVIKSWTTTGNFSASLNKSWYVTSGSSYQVIASATVYDSAGNYVDSGTAYSSVVSY